MAVFRAGVESQSPLLYQLRGPADGILIVTGFTAQGTNDSGSTSRPVIYQPASVGTAAVEGHIECLDVPGVESRALFVSQFFTPPTTPSLPRTTSNLPLSVIWSGPREEGWVLTHDPFSATLPDDGFGQGLVVFAQTSGGHSWTSSFTWEEL